MNEIKPGLREAYLAGVRRGASDGLEHYPEVADTWLAAFAATPAPPRCDFDCDACRAIGDEVDEGWQERDATPAPLAQPKEADHD